MDNIVTTGIVWDCRRIRTARERQGLTAVDAAKKLEITPEYLSRVEHAAYTPSAKLIKKMSELYDVPIAFFLVA